MQEVKQNEPTLPPLLCDSGPLVQRPCPRSIDFPRVSPLPLTSPLIPQNPHCLMVDGGSAAGKKVKFLL